MNKPSAGKTTAVFVAPNVPAHVASVSTDPRIDPRIQFVGDVASCRSVVDEEVVLPPALPFLYVYKILDASELPVDDVTYESSQCKCCDRELATTSSPTQPICDDQPIDLQFKKHRIWKVYERKNRRHVDGSD
ncbi:uncharacterized protein [Rutidosis leptorrhynchoides]|uniref:uncharacterized protein n=1 Tax=Rutidosis leptorrhynchoides TaxID=125765 RepID=UPI003A99B5D9